MKIIYWISTIILSIFLLWSSYTYLFSKATIEGIRALGFPKHFRIQLALLKVIAVVVILLPQIPLQIKEWGYAGIAFFFITAIVAHAAHKDPIIINSINFLLLAVLVASYISMYKLRAIN